MAKRFNRFKAYSNSSKWEEGLAESHMLQELGFQWHPAYIKYTVPATYPKYYPDYKIDINGIVYYIECKGWFRDSSEVKKYIHIKNSLKDNERLVMLFQKPYQKMPGAKIRKDGTIRTYAEWAEKEELRWFTENTIKDLLL